MDLRPGLQQRREAGLYRSRQVLDGSQGREVSIDGHSYLSFCSNDYLGLASDPRLVAALKEGAELYGVGSGAAHLVSGHSRAHQALEEELADFTGRPRALLFSTGYMANLGVVSALAGRGDRVLEDRLNHASLLDAARLSGARLQRYRHRDMQALAEKLDTVQRGQTLLASDAVFSMDGDSAPLAELSRLASHRRSWLLVDDAHGFGVLGPGGRGSLAQAEIEADDNLVLMATLGKACGVFGAFVAGSEALVETLIQQARTYIYTTAIPPALAWATRTALRLLRASDDRRQRLAQRITQFRRGAGQLGLELMASETAIQPLVFVSPERTLAASAALRSKGILVSAIRPPTVPEGSSRLRVTLSAVHSSQDVDRLLDALSPLAGAA